MTTEAHRPVYDSDPETDLHAVLVEYDDRPDRCTFYPRGLPADERLTLWLTVDCGAVVDLAAAR